MLNVWFCRQAEKTERFILTTSPKNKLRANASRGPWRDVPEKYGKWMTVYQRFRRWSESGVWEVFATLGPGDSGSRHDIDSTDRRPHLGRQRKLGTREQLAARGAGSPVTYWHDAAIDRRSADAATASGGSTTR
jgi:hypothetical protein